MAAPTLNEQSCRRPPLTGLAAVLEDLGTEPTTTLVGPGGERLVLPAEVFEVLRGVVDAMAGPGGDDRAGPRTPDHPGGG